LILGAIAGRADVRDVLVAANDNGLGSLPLEAVVGTSSLRRQAQLLHARPDLRIRSIRGNVETRIRKVLEGQYEATVLAAAGVTRLELDEYISQWLPLEVMLPAPGQGALGVQCRAGDEALLELLSAVHQADVAAAVTAERSFLNQLGGGCATPVAAYAVQGKNGLHMTGLVAALSGGAQIRVQGRGSDSRELGTRLAQEALEQGAGAILDHV
jgi:hydroxymethylbilane synthase